MTKKILALLLCFMMVLSQSTMCFGETLAGEGADNSGDQGSAPVLQSIVAEPETLNVPPYADNALIEKFVANNIKVKATYDDESTGTVDKADFTVAVAGNTATVTYNGETDTVALSQSVATTEPIVLDFEDDMGGMTAANWNADNVLDLSLEDGALKCDYTYVTGERSYLYLPLDNVDGSYYDTMKIKARVENVEGNPGSLRMYYTGANKTTAEHCGESSLRYKTFAYTGATESEGVYSSNYQEYIINFSTEANWKDLYLSKIRIDGLHNMNGTVYIDSIELYNKELHTVKEPINFEFTDGLDGVTASSTSGITIAAEDGKLKGELTAVEKYLYVPMGGADGSYYDTMDIRIKVTSAQNNGTTLAKNAAFAIFYKGKAKADGSNVDYASGTKQKNIKMTNMTEQSDGSYADADFFVYTVDFSAVTGWADTNIETLRIDPIKNLFGTFEIDYIRFYHKEEAPTLTGIAVAPKTLTVPYANQSDIKGYVEGAITSVTATYSDSTTAPVTSGYTVAINGEVATVTYEGLSDTIALTLEEEPQAPSNEPVWDFESGMDGVTVKNWESNVLTLSLESGALKCDYSYDSGERSYIYLALDNIDGAYYDTLKIRAKIASLGASSQFARLYYDGIDKVTSESYTATSTRYKSFTYTGLTENNGVYSNSDYVDYVIDLSTMPDWSSSTISRFRIDGINNATALLYIDSIEFYHKEEAPTLTGIAVAPKTLTVPYANQTDIKGYVEGAITSVTATYSDSTTAPVTSGYTVAINGEVATVTYEGLSDTIALTLEEEPQAPSNEPVWDFESGMDGVTVKNWGSNVMTATVENGNLKCDFSFTSGERSYIYLALDNIDGAYYNTLKIRAKIASVNTATQTFRMFFTGEDKTTQEAYPEATARGKNVTYATLTENNGVYSHSDYTEYEIDLSAISKWSDSYISKVRIDALANASGVLYIDSIGFYHKEEAPTLTGIAVAPKTLTVPYANQTDIKGYVEGAITSVTATYSDSTTAPVTSGYTVAINGEVATVTYGAYSDTIALTLESGPQEPSDDSIVFDFESGLGGITASSTSGMSIAAENGKLVGSITAYEKYLYIPLNNIDGAYYDTMKIKVKVTSATSSEKSNASTAYFGIFYTGTSKSTGDNLAESGARQRNLYITDLIENDGVYSNADFVEYILDFSTLTGWSDAYVSRLRIDPLKNIYGTFEIDSIEFYHTEAELVSIAATPATVIVPLANQGDVQGYVESVIEKITATYGNGTTADITTGYTVSVADRVATVTYEGKTTTIAIAFEGEEIPDDPGEIAAGQEYIIYNFDNNVEGFTKEGGVTLSQENGYLKYESVAAVSGDTYITGDMVKTVDYDMGQYYKVEMRIKLIGVSPTLNVSAAAPRLMMYFDGTGADGTAYTISSVRQALLTYPNVTLTEDGLYDSDWQVVTLDLASLTSWNLASINKIRFDVLKDAEGLALIDYIKFYSVPEVTDIKFDDGDAPATSVPVDTEKITLTLSDALYEIKANAVSITSDDGVKVDIKSVAHNKSTNKVEITIGELESMTNYSLVINTNALANEKQALYKAIKRTFTTEKGVLECDATGNGNSAELAFSNSGTAKDVVLVASVWDGNKYVGKVTEAYEIGTGDTTYTFSYSAVTGGDKVEVSIWEYAGGKVNAVYGKKVFTFER